jgi:hypothetical protein
MGPCNEFGSFGMMIDCNGCVGQHGLWLRRWSGAHCDGYGPEACVVVAVAMEDGDVIVCDGDFLSGDGGDTAFVAQLANSEQRVWLQVGKNVCSGCRCWQV